MGRLFTAPARSAFTGRSTLASSGTPSTHACVFICSTEGLGSGDEEDSTWLHMCRAEHGVVSGEGGGGGAIRRDVFFGNSEGLVAFNEM